MSISGIQGQLLEVTVLGCHKLKDTEWISRQDPYVCLEYATTKFRTRTCTDGGKNPVFQEKLVLTLIEGLREINVVVWNSNTLSFDDYIGSGKSSSSSVPSALPYAAPHHPQVSMYAAPPAASMSHLNPTVQPQPTHHLHLLPILLYQLYPPTPAAYPSTSPYPYPPNPSTYPLYPYPPTPDKSTYPPAVYLPPPSTYPPPSFPPPHHASPYPHSGHYPGIYPPPS